MRKTFQFQYVPGGNDSILFACRCCLATDVRLYTLVGSLAEAYRNIVGSQISTNLIRSVDRVAHKLVLDFTLGLDAKVINMYHIDSSDIDFRSIIQFEESVKDIININVQNKKQTKDILDYNILNYKKQAIVDTSIYNNEILAEHIIDVNIENEVEPVSNIIDVNIDNNVAPAEHTDFNIENEEPVNDIIEIEQENDEAPVDKLIEFSVENEEPAKNIIDINIDNIKAAVKHIIDVNIDNHEEPIKDIIDVSIENKKELAKNIIDVIIDNVPAKKIIDTNTENNHEPVNNITDINIENDPTKDIIDFNIIINEEVAENIIGMNIENNEASAKNMVDINIHNRKSGKNIIDINIDDDDITDVLNDFEEIRNSLNEVDNIEFNNECSELNHDTESSFNEQVDRLLRGKEMNADLDELLKKDFSAKSIDSVIKDLNKVFLGKNLVGKKIMEDQTSKYAMEDEGNSVTTEDFLNANLNDSLPDELNFNDVSINTTDLNDNSNSNLVATFNEFILHGLEEKFQMQPKAKQKETKQPASKDMKQLIHLEAEVLKTPKRDKLELMKKAEKRKLKRSVKPSKKIEPEKRKEKTETEKRREEAKSKTEVIIPEIKAENIEDEPKIPELPRPKKNLKELIAAIDAEYTARRLLKIKQNIVKKSGTEDWIKFGSKYNFRVFELTEAEQLEELKQKKECPLYKAAPFKCELCVKGFRSQETIQNHGQVHKATHGLYECGICRSRHKTESRRKRHANTHRLKFCCTQCEFVARSSQKAEAHYEWHIGKTYTCRYCGQIFGKASTHLSHVRLRHPGRCVACEHCGESFLGSYGLQLHVRRIHNADSKTEDTTDLYCFVCRMQFRNKDAFKRHKALSGETCFPDNRPCAECGENFETFASLLQHRRLRHAAAPLQCEMCDASFTNVLSRDTHFERVHLDKRKRRDFIPPVKKSRGVRRVMCETCGNKYHSPAALAYHQRSHSGERPFPCPSCHKSFAFAHTLQAHVRIHTGERPFNCVQCPRAFQNANNLRRHIRIVHKGEREYVRCGVCFKWLSSLSAAKTHALLHKRNNTDNRVTKYDE